MRGFGDGLPRRKGRGRWGQTVRAAPRSSIIRSRRTLCPGRLRWRADRRRVPLSTRRRGRRRFSAAAAAAATATTSTTFPGSCSLGREMCFFGLSSRAAASTASAAGTRWTGCPRRPPVHPFGSLVLGLRVGCHLVHEPPWSQVDSDSRGLDSQHLIGACQIASPGEILF